MVDLGSGSRPVAAIKGCRGCPRGQHTSVRAPARGLLHEDPERAVWSPHHRHEWRSSRDAAHMRHCRVHMRPVCAAAVASAHLRSTRRDRDGPGRRRRGHKPRDHERCPVVRDADPCAQRAPVREERGQPAYREAALAAYRRPRVPRGHARATDVAVAVTAGTHFIVRGYMNDEIRAIDPVAPGVYRAHGTSFNGLSKSHQGT